MVELKIKDKVYQAVNIRWRWPLFGWSSWSATPLGLELSFVEPFYYTPAPPAKRKNEKIWGQCKKFKKQKQMKYIDLMTTVYMGNQKFRLYIEDERKMFANYFETLDAMDKL